MISICILTKNSARTLKSTLDSTLSFPEVILLDTGSTDSTLAIARSYPDTRVYEAPFTAFGPLRNHLATLATHDWILALDSDEIISPPLLLEIQKLSLNSKTAYTMPRHNFYNNKRIRGCGWSPDRVARLYHRNHTRFCPANVHESLETKNLTPLSSPLLHTPYLSTTDFLSKMQHYSTLFAEQHKGKNSSLSKAMLHALFAFFRSYFLKRGILDGKEGFIISIYNANTTFYKYLKLADNMPL